VGLLLEDVSFRKMLGIESFGDLIVITRSHLQISVDQRLLLVGSYALQTEIPGLP